MRLPMVGLPLKPCTVPSVPDPSPAWNSRRTDFLSCEYTAHCNIHKCSRQYYPSSLSPGFYQHVSKIQDISIAAILRGTLLQSLVSERSIYQSMGISFTSNRDGKAGYVKIYSKAVQQRGINDFAVIEAASVAWIMATIPKEQMCGSVTVKDVDKWNHWRMDDLISFSTCPDL